MPLLLSGLLLQCCYKSVRIKSIDGYLEKGKNMNRKKKLILCIVNAGCFLALVLSCIIPIERKENLCSNIEIEDFRNWYSIPRIGSVTDDKQIKLKFSLYDEKLYGINLYFCVDGEEENGEVTCTISHDDEVIGERSFSVEELASLNTGSSLNAVELLADNVSRDDGEYEITITGSEIPSKTRVSLLGNVNTGSFVKYEDDFYGNYYSVLYMIEIRSLKHPYIWAATLILALSLLCSYVFYISSEESKIETVK